MATTEKKQDATPATDEGTATLRVFRYVPEEDDEPYFETFEIETFEGMTVLDALIKIRDEQDPSLPSATRAGWRGAEATPSTSTELSALRATRR